MNRSLAAKLSISFFSAILSIYALNFILLFFFRSTSPVDSGLTERKKIADQLGLPFDQRSKLEVMNDFRKHGVQAYPSIAACHFIKKKDVPPLPLAGISRVKTVLCNESGKYISYDSDRYGFRNPDDIWNSEAVDFLLVGDSFAHGFCVESEKDVSGVLRTHGFSVANLAITGNGPLAELATLVEYAGILKPQKVLWFYFEGNDLSDLELEKTSPVLRSYIGGNFSQDLIHKQPQLDLYMKAFSNTQEWNVEHRPEEKSDFWRFVTLFDLKLRATRVTFAPECYEKLDPDFDSILKQASAIVRSWGGQLYFVYLPQFRRYYYSRVDENYCSKAALLSLVSKDLKIPVIDIDQVFKTRKDPLALFPLKVKGHYTEEGYRLIAERMINLR